MKNLFTSSLILFSLSTFASAQSLLLDAACRVNCYVGTTEIPSEDQGNGTFEHNYSNFYIDLFGLTREEIEAKRANDFTPLCKDRFGEKAYHDKSDCLFFKH